MKKPTNVRPSYEAPRAETVSLDTKSVVLSVSAGFGNAGDNGNNFGDPLDLDW